MEFQSRAPRSDRPNVEPVAAALIPLLRFCAVAGGIGGALRIGSAAVPHMPQSAVHELLYAVIDTGLLFGLIGVYLATAARTGRTGLATFVVALIGIAGILGPDAPMFGVDFYLAGASLFIVGLAALSVLLLPVGLFRLPACLWIASGLFGLLSTLTGNGLALAAAEVALGAGYLATARLLLAKPPASFAFNQVTIGCDDPAVSAAFYRTLGFKQIVDSPTNGYARFEAPDCTTLSLHRGGPASEAMVIYFEHPELDAWCKMLTSQGLTFDQMPRDESWGWREARLRDPFGNRICLYWAGTYRRFPPWRLA